MPPSGNQAGMASAETRLPVDVALVLRLVVSDLTADLVTAAPPTDKPFFKLCVGALSHVARAGLSVAAVGEVHKDLVGNQVLNAEGQILASDSDPQHADSGLFFQRVQEGPPVD